MGLTSAAVSLGRQCIGNPQSRTPVLSGMPGGWAQHGLHEHGGPSPKDKSGERERRKFKSNEKILEKKSAIPSSEG